MEVNPEASPIGGKVLGEIAKSLGVQAKTFSDINSFSADDIDIPDLGNDIDISKIFSFLRVSDQIKG